MLNEEAYLNRQADSWKRLHELVHKGDKLKKFTGPEVVEFFRLYRQASADLAYLRTHSSNQSVVDYLNTLTSAAYSTLYRRPPNKVLNVLDEMLYAGASSVRRNIKPILLSVLVTFIGAVWGWYIVAERPDMRHYVIAPEMEPLFAHWREGKHESRQVDENLGMMGMYATNNPRVAIMQLGASAGTAGVLGTVMLFFNGQLIGALSADMNSVGHLGFLHRSIWPHGVSEIGGFLIAGGAGYALAGAILRPGRRRIVDRLKDRGKDVLALYTIGLLMIFAAAPIEGFLSFNGDVPDSVRWALIVGTSAIYLSYFCLYGLGRDVREASEKLDAAETLQRNAGRFSTEKAGV